MPERVFFVHKNFEIIPKTFICVTSKKITLRCPTGQLKVIVRASSTSTPLEAKKIPRHIAVSGICGRMFNFQETSETELHLPRKELATKCAHYYRDLPDEYSYQGFVRALTL